MWGVLWGHKKKISGNSGHHKSACNALKRSNAGMIEHSWVNSGNPNETREKPPYKQEVGGSSPSLPTTCRLYFLILQEITDVLHYSLHWDACPKIRHELDPILQPKVGLEAEKVRWPGRRSNLRIAITVTSPSRSTIARLAWTVALPASISLTRTLPTRTPVSSSASGAKRITPSVVRMPAFFSAKLTTSM